MRINMQLHTNPRGCYGGADFEAEVVPGIGVLGLDYDVAAFSPHTHEALAELARGLDAYAADPNADSGFLPSARFSVTRLYGEPSASDLSVYRLAGIMAASDFHKRISAKRSVA